MVVKDKKQSEKTEQCLILEKKSHEGRTWIVAVTDSAESGVDSV